MEARKRKSSRTVVVGGSRWLLFAMVFASFVADATVRADGFTKPTAEELNMTSLPGYPGAPAVILFHEMLTKDDLHVQQFYYRIKILTEEGKRYANVSLRYGSYDGDGYNEGSDNQIGDIEGRTIHADGTIIPFTGKPYLKTIEKEGGYKLQERVFTLPDVEIGSIIEYRYALRYNDHIFEAPDWYIQRELFLKSGHYVWNPTAHDLQDPETDSPITSISWFKILPPGTEIERRELPGRDQMGRVQSIYELHVKDVPPTVEEEFMPPMSSFTYRVLFNFTPFRTGDEYWKSRGKNFFKRADNFIGPNSDLRQATNGIVAGATTDEEKLRKIYAAVMSLENSDYTREHEKREDKAEGLGKVNNTNDVLTHKRGNGTELTELFIAMARAAGMKAYLMFVTSRTDSVFAPAWLNFRQLNSSLAIVNVGGKEVYFDPGSRYCPYGMLIWGDTNASGLRQSDAGVVFGSTPGEAYTVNTTGRTANLMIDGHGAVTGKINVSYSGNAAISWRHRALREDEESVNHAFRTSMEQEIPKSMQVTVSSIKNLASFDQPLLVEYAVTGSIGTTAGKRLVLPVDLFHVGERATFPQEKREEPVYFHYPQVDRDAIRINFPKDLAAEATPASSKLEIKNRAVYVLDVAPASNSITVRRTCAFNDIIVKKEEYPELRTYYSQFEAKDQESVVLKAVAVPAAATVGN